MTEAHQRQQQVVESVERMQTHLDAMLIGRNDEVIVLARSAFISMELQQINGVENLAKAVTEKTT